MPEFLHARFPEGCSFSAEDTDRGKWEAGSGGWGGRKGRRIHFLILLLIISCCQQKTSCRQKELIWKNPNHQSIHPLMMSLPTMDGSAKIPSGSRPLIAARDEAIKFISYIPRQSVDSLGSSTGTALNFFRFILKPLICSWQLEASRSNLRLRTKKKNNTK